MRNVIFLSGPMGSGIRPKKYFEATRELMRKQTQIGHKTEDQRRVLPVKMVKTA